MVQEEIMEMLHLPNEAKLVGFSYDGFLIIKYKGRKRKVAMHNYLKPNLIE